MARWVDEVDLAPYQLIKGSCERISDDQLFPHVGLASDALHAV
jgi:hypothetical protein